MREGRTQWKLINRHVEKRGVCLLMKCAGNLPTLQEALGRRLQQCLEI